MEKDIHLRDTNARVTQVTYRFDTQLFRDFKAACIKRGITPNVVVAQLLQEQLLRWDAAAQEEIHD